MLNLKYSVDLFFMAAVCLPNRSWIFVCLSVFVSAFPPEIPAAASVCVATLDLHVKTHIYGLCIPGFRLQGLRCWFLSSPVDIPSLHAHIHTHSHRPVSSQPLPSGRGYAVSFRLGLSLGGSPEGKPERKEGVEWMKKKKPRKRKILGSRFVLWIESREWKRDLENESEFRQGSGVGGCCVRRERSGGGEEG